MPTLTAALLGDACRIFLEYAYQRGPVPLNVRRFRDIPLDAPLDDYLKPPVCQVPRNEQGRPDGFAFRLGRDGYPHLKMRIQECEGHLLFLVDTHDTVVRLPPNHPDAPAFARIQAENRQLKEEIERAWEKAGLSTFQSMLRSQLAML